MIKEPICVHISDKHSEKVMDFAEKVSLTTNYSDCGQNDYRLKVYQHYIGKMGELATFLYLRKGYEINEPDFKIYHGKDKSWDSDLKVGKVHISIKTQDISSAKRFGLSWTFQHINGGRSDASIKSETLVIPTLYDNSYYDKTRIVLFPSIDIRDVVFGEPKKESLKGKKLVMYANDNYKDLDEWLEDLNIELISS